jgi:hypothetical protein
VAGKVVAVVDEIADSGQTLALVAEQAAALGARRVVTATLVSHSWANPAPQVSALVTDAFVMFPWDQQVLVDGSWQPHPETIAGLAAQANPAAERLRVLEIRRHAERDKPGPHLNQAGVEMARRVGAGLGPFERVVTSALPRTCETALAMGFAVDEEHAGLNIELPGVEAEVAWDAGLPAAQAWRGGGDAVGAHPGWLEADCAGAARRRRGAPSHTAA